MNDNIEIPVKDINLIGKQIYNIKTNKYGMITGMFLERFAGRLGHFYKAYYDNIESDSMVFAEDFYKGDLQFVIIDMPTLEKFKEKEIEEIKEFMADRFCNNTIRYITEEEHKKSRREQEWHGILDIMGKVKELDSISADVVQDNYSMLKYFNLFLDGIITEKQMLYGLVNVLSSELRVKRDYELNEAHKSFEKQTKKLLKENMKEWIEENPEKYVEMLKRMNKNE